MHSAWKAHEFRRIRMALIAVSIAALFGFLMWDTLMDCGADPCGEVDLYANDFVLMAVLAGLLHLGLILSWAAERGTPLARAAAALFLLPYTAGAAGIVSVAAGVDGGRGMGAAGVAVALLYAGLHGVQLWILAGLPLPRVTPAATCEEAPAMPSRASTGDPRPV